jgi:hypothetical protein
VGVEEEGVGRVVVGEVVVVEVEGVEEGMGRVVVGEGEREVGEEEWQHLQSTARAKHQLQVLWRAAQCTSWLLPSGEPPVGLTVANRAAVLAMIPVEDCIAEGHTTRGGEQGVPVSTGPAANNGDLQ